jgi:hypothetical protein
MLDETKPQAAHETIISPEKAIKTILIFINATHSWRGKGYDK